MPTKRKTPQHTVAADDALWQRVRRKAAANHETISDVVRRALVQYDRKHPMPENPDA